MKSIQKAKMISIITIALVLVIASVSIHFIVQTRSVENSSNLISRLPDSMQNTNSESSEYVTIDSFSTPLASLGMLSESDYQKYLDNTSETKK